MKPITSILATILVAIICYRATLRVQRFEFQREARLVVAVRQELVLAAGGRNYTKLEKRALVNFYHGLQRAKLIKKIHTLHVFTATNVNEVQVPLIP